MRPDSCPIGVSRTFIDVDRLGNTSEPFTSKGACPDCLAHELVLLQRSREAADSVRATGSGLNNGEGEHPTGCTTNALPTSSAVDPPTVSESDDNVHTSRLSRIFAPHSLVTRGSNQTGSTLEGNGHSSPKGSTPNSLANAGPLATRTAQPTVIDDRFSSSSDHPGGQVPSGLPNASNFMQNADTTFRRSFSIPTSAALIYEAVLQAASFR